MRSLPLPDYGSSANDSSLQQAISYIDLSESDDSSKNRTSYTLKISSPKALDNGTTIEAIAGTTLAIEETSTTSSAAPPTKQVKRIRKTSPATTEPTPTRVLKRRKITTTAKPTA